MEGAFDSQRERVAIIDPLFLPLSLDDLRVARAGIDGAAALPGGISLTTSAQLSVGIDGLGARSAADASPLLPLSRAGSDAAFEKMEFATTLAWPVARHMEFALRARAQTSFGQVMANAEQIGIATTEDLSPLPSGTLQGDKGVVVRGEAQFPFAFATADSALRIAPYAFGGWGRVGYARPTIVERRSTDAHAYGLGIRLAGAEDDGTPAIRATAEYGRARLEGLRGEADRFLFSFSTTF